MFVNVLFVRMPGDLSRSAAKNLCYANARKLQVNKKNI